MRVLPVPGLNDVWLPLENKQGLVLLRFCHYQTQRGIARTFQTDLAPFFRVSDEVADDLTVRCIFCIHVEQVENIGKRIPHWRLDHWKKNTSCDPHRGIYPHIFLHSIWPLTWHIFWHTFHWYSIKHSIWTFCTAFYLPVYPTNSLSSQLAFLSDNSDIYSDLLPDILCDMWSDIHSDPFYLTCILTYDLTIQLAVYLTSCLTSYLTFYIILSAFWLRHSSWQTIWHFCWYIGIFSGISFGPPSRWQGRQPLGPQRHHPLENWLLLTFQNHGNQG